MLKKTILTLVFWGVTTQLFAENSDTILRHSMSRQNNETLHFLAQQFGQNFAQNLLENDATKDRQNVTPKVFVAVSFSMPLASLKKLAIDARDAQIPLVFRGVRVEKELKVKVEEAPLTVEKRYGKHLLLKGLKDFEWLVETGVSVQIDPQVFTSYGIREVPVLVVSDGHHCQPMVNRFHRVSGDVSLRYSLETLKKEIEAQLHKESQINDSNSEIHTYNKNTIGHLSLLLDRLGGRP